MSYVLTTDIRTFDNVMPSFSGVQFEKGNLTPSSSSSVCSSGTSSRLDSVLLDYKQFLAARIIQRQVRSWLSRRASHRQDQAATTIARWWRGFNVRNKRYAMVQAELQRRLAKYYHTMATKTQSLFRGWQARMKVQDFEGMNQLRMQYAEDMLSTLVKSLHKMKKNHLLPGIYSLRESVLLNKIDGLSLTFGYRFHNGRMRAAIAQRRAMLAQRRSEFRKAILYTRATFPEPNSVWSQQTDFCEAKQIGTQQQRIFLLYDKCNRDVFVKDILQKVSARLRNDMAKQREDIRKVFCRDLIRRNTRVMGNRRLQNDEEFDCNCKPKDPDNDLCG